MAQTVVYISAAVVIIIILFLIAALQNSVDEESLLATPTIPKNKAVLTSFASTKINAPTDEVWATVINFKDFSKWSPFSEHKWKEVTADGTPLTGSTGTFKLSIDGFPSRILPIQLTMLDRAGKMIAEKTTSYPGWLLTSERVQQAVPVEGQKGMCEYRTWHTIEGVAAYFLLLTAQDDLLETQKRCADGLKDFIEGRGS